MSKYIWHHVESDDHAVSPIKENFRGSGFGRFLTNARGFALAETIVALLILSFALVGLLTMVQYTRIRAISNYNDRYVLYRLDGEMQRIKFRFQSAGDFGILGTSSFNIPNLGAHRSRPIQVTVNILHTIEWDLSVGNDIGYHKIVATAEWNENQLRQGRRQPRPERRSIILREDYFFRRQAWD